MNQSTNKPGYIIVLTMLIISAAMLLITYMVNRGYYAVPEFTIAISRQKAKMLALSGVQIAAARLAGKPVDKKKAPDAAQPGQEKQSPLDKRTVYFLEEVLPYLNRMQTFNLKEASDGIDGTIEIIITSEEGKINPNNFYDFKKKEFKGAKDKDGGLKKQLETLLAGIVKQSGTGNIVAALDKFYKAEGQPIQEVTELLYIPEFEVFKDQLYFEPSRSKKEVAAPQAPQAKMPVYLTDIFTVYNDQTHVDPWLLSNSLAAALGLKTTQAGDVQGRKELIKALEKNFKPYASWAQDWDKGINQWQGKPFAALPKGIEPLLSTTFEPRYFSVLSIGIYRKVEVRVLAILERVPKDGKEKMGVEVVVKKLYLL